MPGVKWLQLLVRHIPEVGEHRVRYYGGYSNRSRGERRADETPADTEPIEAPYLGVATAKSPRQNGEHSSKRCIWSNRCCARNAAARCGFQKLSKRSRSSKESCATSAPGILPPRPRARRGRRSIGRWAAKPRSPMVRYRISLEWRRPSGPCTQSRAVCMKPPRFGDSELIPGKRRCRARVSRFLTQSVSTRVGKTESASSKPLNTHEKWHENCARSGKRQFPNPPYSGTDSRTNK